MIHVLKVIYVQTITKTYQVLVLMIKVIQCCSLNVL